MNQDYIVETLRNQGVPESEIQARLQRWKVGEGSYDPISDRYVKIPLPHQILPLESDSEPSETVNNDVKEQVGEVSSVPSKRVGMFVVKSANDTIIEARQRPNPKSLYMGLVYEGELCCCFADSFIGKSLYAVQMGVSIASTQLVLFFDFELSDKMFQLRYTSDLGELYKFPDGFFRVSVDPGSLNVGEDFEATVIRSIEETAIEMNATCLIVDNLTWICQASEKGEVAAALMKDLWGMTRKHGWTILVISHTPKRNLSNPISQNDLAGSKRLFNFFDSCFAIGKSARAENERYIKQLKVRSGLLEYHADNVVLCKIEKNGAFTKFEHIGFANEKDLLRETESEDDKLLRDAIFELKDQGKSYQQIADQLGTYKAKVCRILKRRK